MKGLIFSVFVLILFVAIQGCGPSRRFGTTIEKDENNPCITNMIVQLGIAGTAADSAVVRRDLEACYGKACFIPCDKDSTKGCRTKITIVVRLWAHLTQDESTGYHYVEMVDDDGLPSTAYIGKANTDTVRYRCKWRRNAHPRTYCHEVLHLCGLPDQYCSRIYDPVTRTSTVELTCKNSAEPDDGKCCTPTAEHTRCSSACEGHEHDIMASLDPEVSCENILDVLKRAGQDKCPKECCGSNTAFNNTDEIFVGPGYLHFGDKSVDFNAIGVTVEYSKEGKSGLGLTIDAGGYTKSDNQGSYKQSNTLLTLTAGVNYIPKQANKDSKFTIITHALLGVLNWSSKTTVGTNSGKSSLTSINANVGASLNYMLNQRFGIRILQLDYMPTFFGKTLQNNIRIGAGFTIRP